MDSKLDLSTFWCWQKDLGRKKWMKRTPAMAEGLTGHVWTIKELMMFKVLIQ
jgi:hypothetical protein